LTTPPPDWPYRDYVAPADTAETVRLRFIPYHDRGNRGTATMRVFIPTTQAAGQRP
jgi:hypothetical protein